MNDSMIVPSPLVQLIVPSTAARAVELDVDLALAAHGPRVLNARSSSGLHSAGPPSSSALQRAESRTGFSVRRRFCTVVACFVAAAGAAATAVSPTATAAVASMRRF